MSSYSPHTESLLQKGEVFKDWDKFIEETAYFIISRPQKFESRGLYEEFGRLMYQKYTCIGHPSFGNPWVNAILVYKLNVDKLFPFISKVQMFD
jgi:hypothetical protein